ncbi:hypothetical protein GCM10023331_23300 [Algivirga pacifica]|uniref:Uncharacterized protein n=2 Tax=Algivirga pacifica TaxID=1162670 RepID=A0ABP9DGJ5_9BACT
MAQGVFTVSNTVKVPAQYTSLATAVAEVPSGSTLMLQPSDRPYEQVLINKNIKIVGGGFKEREAYNEIASSVDRIIVLPGGYQVELVNLKTAKLEINDFNASGNQDFGKVEIEYCQVNLLDLQVSDVSTFVLDMNVMNSLVPRFDMVSASTIGGSSIQFSNNVIGYLSGIKGGCTFVNNLFIPGNLNVRAFEGVEDVMLLDNIFYGTTGANKIGILTASGCVLKNNIAFQLEDKFTESSIDNTLEGNVDDTNPRFTAVRSSSSFVNMSLESNLSLEENSPALGTGYQGGDVGITGGAYPFVPSRRYAMPYIKSIKIDKPVIDQQQKVRVTIEAEYPSN